jgi:hypothetical protein
MVIVEKTLAELLPNRLFSVDGREPAPLAAGIVVGRVAAVTEGRGYVIEGDDADSMKEVPFDTEDVLVRTIDVTLEIAQGWGEVTAESTISFGARIGGREEDPQSAIDNWSQLGEIIVVLNAPGWYKYDPTLYSVRQSGSLIGTVSEDGTISFPAMAEREQQFLHGTPTLSDLEKAANEDDQTIAVNVKDGYARK